jgi:hypothetical protein
LRIATAGLLLAALVATSACSNKATTTSSDGSTTTTTADGSSMTTDASGNGKSVTVQTKEGSATFGTGVDPGKLGAPVYPGAQTSPDSQGSFSASTNAGSTVMATFKTTDDFGKVYDYYKAQMPAGSEGMKMSMGTASSATFQVGKDGAPDQVTVQISSDKPGQTTILIAHVVKNGASAAPSPAATDTPAAQPT